VALQVRLRGDHLRLVFLFQAVGGRVIVLELLVDLDPRPARLHAPGQFLRQPLGVGECLLAARQDLVRSHVHEPAVLQDAAVLLPPDRERSRGARQEIGLQVSEKRFERGDGGRVRLVHSLLRLTGILRERGDVLLQEREPFTRLINRAFGEALRRKLDDCLHLAQRPGGGLKLFDDAVRSNGRGRILREG
jgi:hypothetical protein